MRIVIPVASLHLGGGCRQLVETANGLQKKGHEVEVIIAEGKPIDYTLTCKVTRVPKLDAAYIPDGDIILPNYYTTVMPSFRAHPFKCVRLSLGFEPMWSNDYEGTLDTYLLPIPLLSISKWHHDKILEETGQESMIVPPGIDLSVFHPDTNSKIPKKIKRIMFIARDPNLNYGFKGIRDFQKAMRLVKKRSKIPFEIHLICPEGEHKLSGLPVKLFGPADETGMAKHYRDCDIFVSASWFESFGFPVLEAMACGTFVVSTDAGGVREFAIDNETCYMTPPKDPSSLAVAILKAMHADTKAIDEIKNKALLTAKKFTWYRYLTQLDNELESIVKKRPITIHSDYLNNKYIKNHEYGKLMAKMECVPHGVDLPANVSLLDMIGAGAKKTAQESGSQITLSPDEIETRILNSLEQKKGFSFISLGDTEAAFLSINQQAVEPYFRLPSEGFANAGYDPAREVEDKADLLHAIQTADVVGIPIFRHGLTQQPLLHYLSTTGTKLNSITFADSTATYKLMETGAFQRILKQKKPLVLCIGNEAQRLANFLVNKGVTVSGVITPVDGMRDYHRVVEKASKITFDLALVAAGAASIPICSELGIKLKKVALDIGKVADEWITGITTLNGEKDYSNLSQLKLFSKHQKSITLEVQSGYQQGLNELIPNTVPLPLNTLPHHWIKKYCNVLQYQGNQSDYQWIRNPIWLIRQIKDAFENTQPLSVVNLDAHLLQKIKLPHYQNDIELNDAFGKLDIVGVPYLNTDYSTSGFDLNKCSILPRKGWIDSSAVHQLQFDYFGRFIPEWLKNKRILLIAKESKAVSHFLTSNGYNIWGTIDVSGGRNQVMHELHDVKKYDIALISAGLDTCIYSSFITNESGKIALDIGNMLHNAVNGCFNVVFWVNKQVHKIE